MALKATLTGLKAPTSDADATDSEVQKKAKIKMKIIAKQEEEHNLLQQIERDELEIKHLNEKTRDMKAKMKDLQEEMDNLRNSGAAVWETTGMSTISYRDPFHTGLSKRTPTGMRVLRIADWTRCATAAVACSTSPLHLAPLLLLSRHFVTHFLCRWVLHLIGRPPGSMDGCSAAEPIGRYQGPMVSCVFQISRC